MPLQVYVPRVWLPRALWAEAVVRRPRERDIPPAAAVVTMVVVEERPLS